MECYRIIITSFAVALSFKDKQVAIDEEAKKSSALHSIGSANACDINICDIDMM